MAKAAAHVTYPDIREGVRALCARFPIYQG